MVMNDLEEDTDDILPWPMLHYLSSDVSYYLDEETDMHRDGKILWL